MRRFARWLLVVVLSLSIGLQWVVVQGAAWVGMFVSYSKVTTISQSLSMTFGGLHPCTLCKAAQRGESTQNRQNPSNPPLKIVLAAPEHEEFVAEPRMTAEAVFVAGVGGRLVVRPVVPPPRAA